MLAFFNLTKKVGNTSKGNHAGLQLTFLLPDLQASMVCGCRLASFSSFCL